MHTVFHSFVDLLRSYQMTRFQEIERSIDNGFHIPYSGFLFPDYVAGEDYLEYRVYISLLEAIAAWNICSFSELQFQKYLEEHSELWEKRTEDRDILRIQAYFTYANALQYQLSQKVKQACEEAKELQNNALFAYRHCR